ncbi:MAG: hypothetical protein PHH59_02925 [Methylovulum sp.]|uniref:hypothetical protein n=1 Tax=Methylovulum sp. TaxID=1916980 RepID=UPI002603F0A8|nr:hypothetical protein [Methylovulum sp.]MDD2722959.1 hypothetical protein [Methylovulum sp.]MDD5123272.1 hypothetical protein [Methylovulum sp.]
MKNLKKILLSLLVASAMGGVSAVAVAESDPGRITYAPTEAIDMVAAKVKVAIDAVSTGSDGEAVAKLIKDAMDASKEINANDKVDMARSRANNKLKSARTHAKENALQEAEQELRNAYKGFQDLKGLL